MGKKAKNKKEQDENNELFDFDNEIIIGVTKIPDEKKKKKKKKNNNKKKSNKKENNKVQKLKVKVKPNEQTEKARKRSLILLKSIIVITLITGVILFLLLSPVFNITEIMVENNSIIPKEEVIELSNIKIGDNIFRVSKIITEKKMKQNPYIESIKLNRKIPNKLSIIVKERKATYAMQIDETSFAYINNQGYILEINSQIANLPQIKSYVTENIVPGARLSNEDLEKLEVVLKIMNIANSNQIGSLITSIDIKDPNNYILRLESEKKTVFFGDSTDINTKILSIKEILEYEKGIEGDILMDGKTNKDGKFLFREKV